MPQNKKQHYVPRFYLKRFSVNGKAINVWLPHQKRKILSASVKSQCYRNYFYGSDPTFETALGYIEAETSQIFNVAEAHKELPPPGSPYHHALTLYVLLQYSRTVYSAESTDEAMDKLAKHMLRDQVAREGINIDDFHIGVDNPSLYFLGIAIPTYPILLDLRYKLLVNTTDIEFVTSDNPAILYNKLLPYDGITSQTGLSTRGLQIFLPLDPQTLLLLYDHDVYRVGGKEKSFVLVDRESDVHEINALQMCAAVKCLYFQSEKFNIEALHRKASQFRTQQKVNLNVFDQPEDHDENAELLAMSRKDISMNLNVSCIRLSTYAKAWRKKFLRLKSRPVSLPRNENLLHVVNQVRDEAKRDDFDFFEYLRSVDKMCGEYWRDV